MNLLGAFAFLFLITIVLIIIEMIVKIFYVRSLVEVLNEISPENRSVQIKHLWFVLIPIVGVYWSFIVVSKLAACVKTEFIKRNIPLGEDKPGFDFGMAYSVFNGLLVLPLPFIRSYLGIPLIISWIIYWRKMVGYKTRLQQNSFN